MAEETTPVKLEQIEEVQDDKNRIVRGWGSVDVADLEGEVLPMDEFKKIMPLIMKRGGTVIDSHSNRICGKLLNYEFKNNPKVDREGVLLTYQVYDDTDNDNEVWDEIKTGERQGLSFGGSSAGSTIKLDLKNYGNNPVKILSQMQGYEFSSVKKPCNPEALNTEVNFFAKSDSIKRNENHNNLNQRGDSNMVEIKEKEFPPVAAPAPAQAPAPVEGDKLDKVIEMLAQIKDVLSAKAEVETGIPMKGDKEDKPEEEDTPADEEKKEAGAGEKVTLPKAVADKVGEAKPKNDTIQIMEKMATELSELKKSFGSMKTISVPRPTHIDVHKQMEDEQAKSLQIIKELREGKKPNFASLREDIVKERTEAVQKIIG